MYTLAPWLITGAGDVAQANEPKAHIYAEYEHEIDYAHIVYTNPDDVPLVEAAPALADKLKTMVKVFSKLNPEPIVALAAIEQAKGVLEKVGITE